ncbi:MAG: hypothetical protein QG558_603 [Campylobacterota bacterium]|nr:hypothetical protein [Campylobacterota bacterium]
MSSTIKRQNHRIHPCSTERKTQLLNFVISQNPARSILVVTAHDTKAIDVAQTKEITLVTDSDLVQPSEAMYDIVISYDLPDKAIIYMTRYARAKEFAIILLGAEDQKNLYAIETLFGRTITQETVAGFEPNFGIAVEQKNKEEMAAQRAKREEERANPSRAPKREFKPKREDRARDDSHPARKPYEGKKNEEKSSNSWEQKKKKPTQFLGNDENGKPIFGTKTRERNHYIDGTPRSDAEKFGKTAFVNKPKFFGEHDKSKKKDEAKKPFNPERKSYEGKPAFNKDEKKPYGEKKPSYNKPKPAHTDTAPKRAPRRINVKSLKPSEDKQ